MKDETLARLTANPIHVAIASTCSGAWPVLYQTWLDTGKDGEEWHEEIATTPTAFVENYDRREKAVTFNEEPDSFRLDARGSESLEMAYAISALPQLLELALAVSKCRNPRLAKMAKAAIAKGAVPDQLPTAEVCTQ